MTTPDETATPVPEAASRSLLVGAAGMLLLLCSPLVLLVQYLTDDAGDMARLAVKALTVVYLVAIPACGVVAAVTGVRAMTVGRSGMPWMAAVGGALGAATLLACAATAAGIGAA